MYVFIAIKCNWTTAINWLLKIRWGQEKEKNKEQPNKLQYCYFQEPQELFCSFSLKFLHFSCWQSLKDYLAMGVEERTLCLCFCPASHVFSRDPCLIVLATVL